MRILFGVLWYILAVTGARAQEKIGIIYKDTAYIGLSAANYNLLKAQLESYNLTEADLIELPGRATQSATYKWVNAYKILQPESCSECEPVYHLVGKSEGLFRIGKWYGNQSSFTLKKLNNLSNEQLRVGQKLLTGYCRRVSASAEISATTKAVIDTPVNSAATANLLPQATGKDTAAVLPKPTTPVRPAEPEPELTYSGYGFFEPEWKSSGEEKLRMGKAAIFKSASGWQDGKFYLLSSILPVGALVKVVNAANNKFIVAKVLAPLPEIKMNEGLLCRLNDAAAALLGCLHEKTFELVLTSTN